MEEDLTLQPTQTAPPISYAEGEPQLEAPIQIGEGVPTVQLPQETIDSRALKLGYGTPELNMTHEDAKSMFQTFGEDEIRQTAATAVDRQRSLDRIDIVNETVNKLGRKMTLPEAMMLQDIITIKQSNPNAVIEDGYAEKYMENLRKKVQEKPDSDLAKAMRVNPKATEQDFLKGQDYKATREMILTQMENAEAALQQQSYLGRGVDLAKYLLPLYANWKQSGFTGGSPFALFSGSDLNRQSADWFNMSKADRDVKMPATGKQLIDSNPALALAYWANILHQSSNDNFLNDFFPVLDLTTVGSILKGTGVLGLRAAESVRLGRAATKAIQTYATGLEPQVTRAALHEATGDVQMAGVVQAAEDVIKNFQGKNVDSPLRPLHSAFVANLQRIVDDSSPYTRGLGQETVNRIVERSAAIYDDVLTKVQTTMKVDRIPAVLAFQKNFTAMAEQIKSEHPHMANSIMDVKFRRDTLNSLYADIYMGDGGQTLFNTERQAMNRVIEQSLGDAKTVEIYGPSKPITTGGTQGGFRTAQGSEYVIASNGTTTRTATRIRPGDTLTFEDAAKPNALAAQRKTTFTPTHEWQDVPKGVAIPRGLESKVDLQTGKHEARVPAGSKIMTSKEKDAVYATADKLRAEGKIAEAKTFEKTATEAVIFEGHPPAAAPKPVTRTGTATGRSTITPHDNKRHYELVGKDGSPGWVEESRLTVAKEGPSQSARGAQPKSARTVYLDMADAQRAYPPQGNFRIVDHGGTLSTVTPAKGGKSWGVSPSQKNIPYSTTPGVGKVPLELFGKTEEFGNGALGYARMHFGNEISELIAGKQASVTIQPKGAGYYIVKTVPWTETNQLTRDLLLTSDAMKTPASMFNAYAGGLVGKLRTPEETLSYLQNVTRKVATFGQSNFEKIIEDSVKEIAALGGLTSWIPGSKASRIWKDWERIMDLSMKVAHPGDGTTGIRPAFRDSGELNQLYLNTLHRSPSEQEVKAAFSYARNKEILEAFKKMNVLKMQTREGNQTWSFGSLTASKKSVTTKAGEQVPYKTVEAEGKRLVEFPGSGAILIVRGKNLDSERVLDLQGLQSAKNKIANQIRQAVLNGEGNLVKLSNPHEFPMKDWVGDQFVDYVYAENAQPRPLSWDRLRVGRDTVYDYEHYVVQPIVHHDKLTGRFLYLGDRTLAGHNIRAMSKDVAEKIDTIRTFLKAGDVQGAEAYHSATKLPQSFEEIHGWFKPGTTAEGKSTGPKLSLDEPIKSAPLGKTTIDLDRDMYKNPRYNGKFKDQTRENMGRFFEGDLQKAKKDVGDPFDMFTLRNEGTKANPDYKMGELKTIDPMVSFQRAMSKAINSTYMDDYKIASIESWIQEFKPYFKGEDRALADSPAYWFYNNENHWLANTPIEIKSALQTAQMQINQFLGIQDASSTWLHQMAQKLSDSLYDSRFSRVALVPAHLLPMLRDPFAFIRSVIFHPKVGLFALPQLFVQASTMANLMIAGPRYAAAATKAMTFYTYSRINKSPEILAHLDQLASKTLVTGKVGFKPGQFLEATEGLESSGFANVSREHIYRDNTTFHDFLGNAGRSFLNAGQWFFEKGEQAVRVSAWYAAYLEVAGSRTTLTGKLTKNQMQSVLQRADELAGNMSRASASSLNRGVLSIPTQFQTFPLRMAELVLGKRLTFPERARLFGTYATLYGIPGAFGLAGFPVGPYINKIAQDKGYVTGDSANSFINNVVTEGLPAVILANITGHGDSSKGNWYNISERYSMQGFDVIKDVIRQDKTFLDIIGGAAYSTFSSFLASAEPFWQSLVDGIKGEGKHPFKIEDTLDPMKDIASVGAGARLWTALNQGKWLTKKEGNMGDVSPANAIFMTIFGLQPQGTNDVVNQAWTRSDEKNAQSKALQIFIREMRRSFEARDAGNYSQADQYESRAFHSLRVSGYPEEEYANAMSAAGHDYEDMISRSTRDYYLKNVPEDRKPTAEDAYQRFLDMTNKGK